MVEIKNFERKKWIDIARGIGIVLMVIGHAAPPEYLEKLIYGFHMPFFFILSGYIYDHEKWEKKGIKELIQQKVKAYVIPYFVLGFINLFLTSIFELVSSGLTIDWMKNIGKYLFGLIYSYGNRHYMPNCTPLWFLLCLLLSNIFLYGLMKIKKLYLQFVVCTIMYGIDLILMYLEIIQLPWHIDSALLGTVFMLFGYIVKKWSVFERKVISILYIPLLSIGVMSILINSIESKVDINLNELQNPILFLIGAFFVSFALLYILYKYTPDSRWLEYIGKNTIIILGFNYFINGVINLVLGVFSTYRFFWLLKSILVMLICTMFICLWNSIKNKYLRMCF